MMSIPHVGAAASYCVLAWADGERGEAHGEAEHSSRHTALLRDGVSVCGPEVT